jgi:carbon starvation protein CstA
MTIIIYTLSNCYLRSSWSWSYGNWIYKYLCNQCLISLKLWVRTPFMARCTRYSVVWLWSSVSPISTMWTITSYFKWAHWTQKRTRHMTFEIRTWDRHNNVAGSIWLMGNQPWLATCLCFFPGNPVSSTNENTTATI